jgi:hypothetical protein
MERFDWLKSAIIFCKMWVVPASNRKKIPLLFNILVLICCLPFGSSDDDTDCDVYAKITFPPNYAVLSTTFVPEFTIITSSKLGNYFDDDELNEISSDITVSQQQVNTNCVDGGVFVL